LIKEKNMQERTRKHIERALEKIDFSINSIKCICDVLIKNLEKEQRKLTGLYKKTLK